MSKLARIREHNKYADSSNRDIMPDAESESNASEISEELDSDAGGNSMSVINEDGVTGSSIYCYIFC